MENYINEFLVEVRKSMKDHRYQNIDGKMQVGLHEQRLILKYARMCDIILFVKISSSCTGFSYEI